MCAGPRQGGAGTLGAETSRAGGHRLLGMRPRGQSQAGGPRRGGLQEGEGEQPGKGPPKAAVMEPFVARSGALLASSALRPPGGRASSGGPPRGRARQCTCLPAHLGRWRWGGCTEQRRVCCRGVVTRVRADTRGPRREQLARVQEKPGRGWEVHSGAEELKLGLGFALYPVAHGSHAGS